MFKHPEFKRLVRKELNPIWLLLVTIALLFFWSQSSPSRNLDEVGFYIQNFVQPIEGEKDYSRTVWVSNLENCQNYLEKHNKLDGVERKKFCQDNQMTHKFTRHNEIFFIGLFIVTFVGVTRTLGSLNTDVVKNVWDYQRLGQWKPAQLINAKIFGANSLLAYIILIGGFLYSYTSGFFMLGLMNILLLLGATLIVAAGSASLYTYQLSQDRKPIIGLVWLLSIPIGLGLSGIFHKLANAQNASLLDGLKYSRYGKFE